MIVAITLIVVGLSLRGAAVIASHGHFNECLCIPLSINTTGIYRLLRHPAYLGSILMLSGVALLCPKAGLIIFITFIYRRMALDEEALLETHCKDYRAYKQKVKTRFIPFLWR